MPTRKYGRLLTLVMALLLISIAACGQNSEPTATPPQGGEDKPPVAGDASVEAIDILILESFPVQINVVAKGNLPDGCTTIDQITQQREGNTFQVTITTARPADKICTEALVPFEEVISLDVYGLAAGTYTVDVNGTTGTFTLDVDNAPQEEGTPYP